MQQAAAFQHLGRYLVYPDNHLRADPETVRKGLRSQSALWPMAISGDFPIFALRINDDMDTLAAAKKVMLFGDFSKYYVRKVGSPLIGAISDKDFWPGFGIAGYIRFDGELADNAAVKHLICA